MAAVLCLAGLFAFHPKISYAANPGYISFQGKVVNADGTNIVNGTYPFNFILWDDPTAGTNRWQELSKSVTVTNGVFQTNLGSATTLPDFNAYPNLYLAIQFNNDAQGYMTPRVQLTSVPYAINSDKLGGLTSASFGQLSTTNAWTNTNSIKVASVAAFQVQNTSNNQVLTVDTSANQVVLGKASTLAGTLVFANSAGANTVAMQLAANPASAYTLLLPTTGPAVSQCLQTNSSTANQLQFGACGGSSTLQNVYDASSSPATITTTAAKGVKIAAGAVPTVDMLTLDNTGFAETNAGIAALQVNYVGGNNAVESSAVRFDFTPGGTSGGTWNGLRIVANATGAASGVNEYGIKLEGPTSPGVGTEKAVYIGTGWDIGLDIQSGGLQLLAQTDPAAPAANNLRIYAKTIAGRVMPKWIAPSGVDTPFQASLGFNRISMLAPSGLASAAATTVFNTWNANVTNAASTFTNPALATTNLFTSVRKGRLTSTTTAGALASSYSTSLMAWRGNAAGLGGFFFTIRFGTSTLQSGNRAFIGLTDVITAPTNVDPTTSTTPGMLGMAINANSGNWNWINNVTGTAPTITGLGANFPVNTTNLYELIIYSPPNGSSITYRIQNLSTGSVTSDTVVSSNLPANTTFLAPRFWMTNNATAAAVAIDSTGWYLESDD